MTGFNFNFSEIDFSTVDYETSKLFVTYLEAVSGRALNQSNDVPTIEWVKIVVAIIGGLAALLTFQYSLRNKAADVLIKLSEDFHIHQKTFLEIEDTDTWKNFEKAIVVSSIHFLRQRFDEPEYRDSPILNNRKAFLILERNNASETLERLEAALQFMYICNRVKSLSVDRGAIEKLCGYHLRLFHRDSANDDSVREQFHRLTLIKYTETYWPSIARWSGTVHLPRVRKLWFKIRDFGEFLYAGILCIIGKRDGDNIAYRWWEGSWSEPSDEARRSLLKHCIDRLDKIAPNP